jgi:hypothetical protein
MRKTRLTDRRYIKTLIKMYLRIKYAELMLALDAAPTSLKFAA